MMEVCTLHNSVEPRNQGCSSLCLYAFSKGVTVYSLCYIVCTCCLHSCGPSLVALGVQDHELPAQSVMQSACTVLQTFQGQLRQQDSQVGQAQAASLDIPALLVPALMVPALLVSALLLSALLVSALLVSALLGISPVGSSGSSQSLTPGA